VMGGSIMVPKPYFTLGAQGELLAHQVPVPKPQPRPRADPRFLVGSSPSLAKRVRARVGRLLGHAPAARNVVYDNEDAPTYRLAQALLASMLRESRARVKVVMPLLDVRYVTERWTHHHRFFQQLASAGSAVFVDAAEFFLPLSG